MWIWCAFHNFLSQRVYLLIFLLSYRGHEEMIQIGFDQVRQKAYTFALNFLTKLIIVGNEVLSLQLQVKYIKVYPNVDSKYKIVAPCSRGLSSRIISFSSKNGKTCALHSVGVIPRVHELHFQIKP